jgi:hypothetical protein
MEHQPQRETEWTAEDAARLAVEVSHLRSRNRFRQNTLDSKLKENEALRRVAAMRLRQAIVASEQAPPLLLLDTPDKSID